MSTKPAFGELSKLARLLDLLKGTFLSSLDNIGVFDIRG
jgi:hypothetical protein